MELRHLRYLLAAVEEGSINRAAARLNVVQPSLSRQIADLERELGVRLLERKARGVVPTPAGKIFAAEAAKILSDLAAAAGRARNLANDGPVHIGVVRNVTRLSFLSAGLQSFFARWPSATFKLSRCSTEELREASARDEFDVIIGYAGTYALPEARVVNIQRDTISLVMPSTHSLANREDLDLAEIAEEQLVWCARNTAPRFHEFMMDACRRSGFAPHIACELEGTDAAFDMVRAGAGCVFTASGTATSECLQGLVAKPIRNLNMEMILQLAWRRRKPSAIRLVRALLPVIRDHQHERNRIGTPAFTTKDTRGTQARRTDLN